MNFPVTFKDLIDKVVTVDIENLRKEWHTYKKQYATPHVIRHVMGSIDGALAASAVDDVDELNDLHQASQISVLHSRGSYEESAWYCGYFLSVRRVTEIVSAVLMHHGMPALTMSCIPISYVNWTQQIGLQFGGYAIETFTRKCAQDAHYKRFTI